MSLFEKHITFGMISKLSDIMYISLLRHQAGVAFSYKMMKHGKI